MEARSAGKPGKVNAGSEDRLKVRNLEIADLERGALASLDNLVPGTSLLDLDTAKKLVREIQSNPLHRLFAAVSWNAGEETVVGTTTLLVEPKLIFAGGRVGHVEDVSVRKGFERQGIGRRLVEHA